MLSGPPALPQDVAHSSRKGTGHLKGRFWAPTDGFSCAHTCVLNVNPYLSACRTDTEGRFSPWGKPPLRSVLNICTGHTKWFTGSWFTAALLYANFSWKMVDWTKVDTDFSQLRTFLDTVVLFQSRQKPHIASAALPAQPTLWQNLRGKYTQCPYSLTFRLLASTGPNTCIQTPAAQPINHCLLIQHKRKFADEPSPFTGCQTWKDRRASGSGWDENWDVLLCINGLN